MRSTTESSTMTCQTAGANTVVSTPSNTSQIRSQDQRPRSRNQEYVVHTIRTQFPGELPGSIATRLWGLQGDDLADLQAAVDNDDALDHQLQDRLLVGEARLGETAPYAGAECNQVRSHRRALQLMLA